MRLFIAIPLSKEATEFVSRELEDIKGKFTPRDKIRFMPEENWHFTLVFLGQQNEGVPAIVEGALKGAFFGMNMPNIEFEKILYGPLDKTPARGEARQGRRDKPPRMIWLTTSAETSNQLNIIKTKIESELERTNVRWQKPSFAGGFGRARESRPHRAKARWARPYRGHLTLARLEPKPIETLPSIEKEFSFNYPALSVSLMESTLKKSGAEYNTLAKISFTENGST